jgi:hypothetical protein
LSDRTFSLAIDIGMYMSQVLLKNVKGLKWQHTTKGSKNWIDYGQPVLASTGWFVFNPVQQLVVVAYGFVKGTNTSSRLREIYEYVKRYVHEQAKKDKKPDSA